MDGEILQFQHIEAFFLFAIMWAHNWVGEINKPQRTDVKYLWLCSCPPPSLEGMQRSDSDLWKNRAISVGCRKAERRDAWLRGGFGAFLTSAIISYNYKPCEYCLRRWGKIEKDIWGKKATSRFSESYWKTMMLKVVADLLSFICNCKFNWKVNNA